MTGTRAATAYAALGWVVVFLAFHVYWLAGGTFGSAGEMPKAPHTLLGVVFNLSVLTAYPVGAGVCLALARDRTPGAVRRVAVILAWVGCGVLIARGGAGLVDDLVRAAGGRYGITGLTISQTTGHPPSTAELWSGRGTDVYFTLGGVLFGLMACRQRGRRAVTARHAPAQ